MEEKWDAFICHASENKEGVVEPLTRELKVRGIHVWYDRWVLTIGDSLRRKIDEGLKHSKYGIVVLSPEFFKKQWPQRELDGLVQREIQGHKVILPVWHNVTREDVASFSLTLADRVSGSTNNGITQLADELARAMGIQLDVPELQAKPAVRGAGPASVAISYKTLEETGRLHRYALEVEVTLNTPPDQGRCLLVILWPREVRIARLQGLSKGEERRHAGGIYRELSLENTRRLWPGQTLAVIGPTAAAYLDYDYDDSTFAVLQERPRDMYYTLYLENHLPVEGTVPFRSLNRF